MERLVALSRSQECIQFFLINPPYREERSITSSIALLRGAVLVLRIPSQPKQNVLGDVISSARRLLPSHPVALWADASPRPLIPAITRSASDAGVRAVLTEPVISGAALRQELVAPCQLAGQLKQWFDLHVGTVDTHVQSFISATLGGIKEAPKMNEMMNHAVLAKDQQTVARSIRSNGYGSPRKLFQIIRTLGVGLEMQRRPAVPVSAVAQQFGYWDAAALRSRMRCVLGLQPRQVRLMAGLETLAAPAARRAGYLRN